MRATKLFTPLVLRGVELPNRVLISPMSQYSAIDGLVQDWHRFHTAGLARGGPGCAMIEVAAVTRDGRGTPGDLGIWSDDQIPGLAQLAQIMNTHGVVPAIQIGHAGRKASTGRPWEGNRPLALSSAELSWETTGASPLPVQEGWPAPRALTTDEVSGLVESFRAATTRAVSAGYRLVEIHAAHGYLLHSFLSPLTNKRQDQYGGSLENRMRFPLLVAAAVRDALPADIPLSVRISAVDGIEGGWELADSVVLSRELRALGVDLIDCSSGGIQAPATVGRGPLAVKRGPGFQVPFAQAVKQEAGIATIAVGLIVDPEQAEAILTKDKADLVAIGREALHNPNWPLHARLALQADPDYSAWPEQYGWWLKRRPRILLE
ncbi:NADH:flavin oxidoreductase/NADH oxidase [Achromobacter deleyi]|uniref:NADH:flavin oxidoreductase/NADH oxidase n=1 Tax=Achromobacter deleyi TaxID=1353891 RepID=UPI0014660D88|nr:NADH:flavin oxidoreductase/NADH oxidase [Achromobacter deleyi]CAB3837100.1 NADPH dehydrogenase [Achromobacter deleyi]